MSKGPYPFKESDIARAFRGARKGGEKVQIVVDVDRRIMRLIPTTGSPVCMASEQSGNEWDKVTINTALKSKRQAAG
jgi:hypothetical protein